MQYYMVERSETIISNLDHSNTSSTGKSTHAKNNTKRRRNFLQRVVAPATTTAAATIFASFFPTVFINDSHVVVARVVDEDVDKNDEKNTKISDSKNNKLNFTFTY